MRAVIYCRVSTKEQVSNLSLATQEKICREYCAREGLSVAAVFIEEGESAKSAQRTKLVEMLAYCRSSRPRIDTLVVHSLSRFSRDVLNHHQIRNTLLAFGTSLRSATETLDNSPSGKLVETLRALGSLSSRTRSGRSGPFRGCKRPTGWDAGHGRRR